MKEGKRPWSFRGNFRVAGADSLRGVVGRKRGLARMKVDWGFRESGMVFALAMLSPKIKDLKYLNWFRIALLKKLYRAARINLFLLFHIFSFFFHLKLGK